jgi:hypothetical protein
MKLLAYFKYFLENTVNLNASRIETLDRRVDTLTAFVKAHDVLGPAIVDVVPQGSYAQKTIIKPKVGSDFDADVLLHMEEQDGWEAKDYIAKLYGAFRASATYRDMVGRRTRCVTVQYANDFHVDIVPWVERLNGTYVTNRHENIFELSDPEQFNVWLEEQTRTTDSHLIEVIRLMKYLRDFKGTFAIKSVILTVFLGLRVNSVKLLGDAEYYGDMPTALVNIVEDLDEYLQQNPTMPVILDPGGTGEDFSQRWDQDGYANFRNKIHHYAGKIRAAYDDTSVASSLEKWQEIFGTEFKKPPVVVALSESAASPPVSERFLERDLGLEIQRTAYRVRMVGRVRPRTGFRAYDLPRRGNRVRKNQKLVFEIKSCDVPRPYDVYWKVRNTGEEAATVGQLRGEITRDSGYGRREESTSYRGSHYVEVYIVKDSACVARDRQPVFVQ